MPNKEAHVKLLCLPSTGGCQCESFKSSFTCSCQQPTYAHDTVVETKEERQARGHPVGHDVPYAAMGGLTGFSSLAEAYQRLDDSGIGKAPKKKYIQILVERISILHL